MAQQQKVDESGAGPLRSVLQRARRATRGPKSPPALDPLLDSLRTHHPKATTEGVIRAYHVASELHDGQLRKSGDPFITHPLSVAQVLADLGMDTVTIQAALLHDAVEDTDVSLGELRDDFGDEVAELIDGLTKLAKIGFRSVEQAQAENYRKMMVAMARDVRVIIVKLADRLDNLRTLEVHSPEKVDLKAKETLELYVPLAGRLGMFQMKAELEDRAFFYLYPKRYQEVVELTERRQPEREEYLQSVVAELEAHLKQAKIRAEVSGRAKNYFSIYQKMVERGREFDEIFDLLGVRVIVDGLRDCYSALGVVHAMWKPIPGRFKDYLAMPKFNMYQSLHTTVVGPDGKALEIQIRTVAMHRMAEYGVAAHWRYKEPGSKDGHTDVPWLGEMADVSQQTSDPKEFMESLRLDLFHDEVFCFTPKGEVKCLPRGAGPVDFAYAVHTEVGHRTVGARVNGRLVPLDTRLDSGDTVEILTTKAPEAHPKEDWLAFVKTSRARSRIKQWYAAHRREEARGGGREMFVKALRREGVSPSQMDENVWRTLLSETKLSGPETLYEALGEHKLAVEELVKLVHRIFHPEDKSAEPEPPARPPLRKQRKPEATAVIVEGAEDVYTKLALCCTPVPGDRVFGFITRGRGVSVHRVDCPNAGSLQAQAERCLQVRWDTTQGGTFVVVLQVDALDRSGLLRDISNTLTEAGINIISSSTWARKDGTSTLRFSFEIGDVAHLDHISRAVRRIEGVFDIYRVLPSEARSDR